MPSGTALPAGQSAKPFTTSAVWAIFITPLMTSISTGRVLMTRPVQRALFEMDAVDSIVGGRGKGRLAKNQDFSSSEARRSRLCVIPASKPPMYLSASAVLLMTREWTVRVVLPFCSTKESV